MKLHNNRRRVENRNTILTTNQIVVSRPLRDF